MLKKILVCLLPWPIKRRLLKWWFGYDLHPSAKIGLAWIFPHELVMEAGSRIDHFTVAIHLDKIEMGQKSSIGRSNWITGFSSKQPTQHFLHQPYRQSILKIGKHSAITKHHHIDCTSPITIGDFVTVAGYYSQLLTHSIDVMKNRQDSNPIHIGDYAFVGTNCVILGGAVLPAYSVLGAKSLLNKKYEEEWKLYGGTPAKPINNILKEAKYFIRKDGFVY